MTPEIKTNASAGIYVYEETSWIKRRWNDIPMRCELAIKDAKENITNILILY